MRTTSSGTGRPAIWQNAGLGERWRDHFLSLDVDTRAGMLVAAGLPEIDAADVAAAMDRRMFDHILPLYRSETYLEDWAFDPASTYPPGLVLWGQRRPVPGSRIRPYRRGGFGRALPRTRMRALVAGRAARRGSRRTDRPLVSHRLGRRLTRRRMHRRILPKLNTRARFPSSAPYLNCANAVRTV